MSPGDFVLEGRCLLSVFDRAAVLDAAGAAGLAYDLDRLSDDLVDLYATEVQGMTAAPAEGLSPYLVPLTRDAAGRVGVDVTADDVAALQDALTGLGFVTSVAMPDHHLIEGYLPVGELLAVTALADQGLLGVQGIARPMTSAGSTANEADFTLEAARTRATGPSAVDGTGVTIGVISDSYNNQNGAANGIASGDLPSSLVFLRDNVPASTGVTGSDEGRAMMELVHDVAPGSPKAFATAEGGEATFAQNIRDLAKATASGGAGAKVIVDDIFYFAEPMFQDGIVAQAVNDVATNSGVTYFSSAGNLQDQSYENTAPTFASGVVSGISASAANYLQFPGGGFTQNITLNSQLFLAGLQWSDPFYTSGGVKSNLDWFVLSGTTVIVSSTSNNITSNVPYEQVGVQGTGTAQLVIRLTAGVAPSRLKWVNFGSNSSGPATIQFATNSPTITPHSAAANAMSVGAAAMFDQRTAESFTSKGPSTFLFDPAGNGIATTVRAKPDILSTDGTSTTFFGQTVAGLPHPLFFGTSAAAPNAAAVAALVRQANPGFTPAQVYAKLKSTADPNVVGGVNLVGAGLVNAYRAVFGPPVTVNPNSTDNFTSGVLGPQWEVYQTGNGRAQVQPSGGNQELVLDGILPTGFNISGLGESILHVNAVGRSKVTLAFDAKLLGTEAISAMPATFAGHANVDGVALSVDGINWFRLSPLTGITTAYQNFVVDISATAAANSLTLTADTRIKFQRFSSSTGNAPATGLAFDNVKVTALSALTASVIDDGTAQRSMIRGFTFDFVGSLISFGIVPPAFLLMRSDGLTIPLTLINSAVGNGKTHLVFSPTGPNVVAGSIPDGKYTLTVDGSRITDDAGNAVDAAGNGIAGSVLTLKFSRFFGDANGDGLVDGTDYLAFRTAYILGTVTPATSIFDVNGDGKIDNTDLQAFLTNFRKRILT